jgi:hypothetical protein
MPRAVRDNRRLPANPSDTKQQATTARNTMMHLNRRHAHGGNNNNEDDDDASPEPSPVQPPNPQQQPRHLSSSSPPRQSTGMSAFSSMPKWTPQSDDLQNHPYNDMIGEESSLPVLPDVPSPYSPPPSSLFSGEEFPAKSIRKKSQHSGGADPLSTGGGRSGGARRLSLQDVSLNANHLLFQHQQRVYSNNSNLENTLTSPPSAQNYNQSQGLPLVHRLKTDLQETNAKMHLLEQENKALSNECERFQREMRKWQQAQDNDSVKMEGLEQNIADLQQELLSCREQLRESKSNLETSEQEKQLKTKDIEHLQEEHKNLQNALADATERENKWLVEKDALQAEIGRLRQVNKSAATLASAREKQQTNLQQEVERVRLELNESKQTCQTLRSKLQEARAKARGSNVSVASAAAAATTTVVPPPPQPNVFTFDTTGSGSGGAPTAVDTDDHKHGVWIFDRLGRIRDAVDRTTLVQEYRKEFTRMKLEHDAEVKSLTAQHEQDLRDVEDETKSKVTARVRDLRRRLQSDFDAKVSTLERQYQAEIARVRMSFQRDCGLLLV